MISSDYIPGGIECIAQRSDSTQETEIVFDLTEWIKKQYRILLEESRKKHEAGANKSHSFCVIYIGSSDKVFGMLETTLSNFKSYYNPAFLPESNELKSTDIFYQSVDIDTASFEVSKRALKVLGLK